MKFFIMPKNEGQELNYTGIQDFPSEKHAKIYAREMARKLAEAMPQGVFSVEIEEVKKD